MVAVAWFDAGVALKMQAAVAVEPANFPPQLEPQWRRMARGDGVAETDADDDDGVATHGPPST